MNNRTLEKINSLVSDIRNIKFCGPSDDPDEQYSVLLELRGLAKKFKNYAKKIENSEIKSLLKNLNTDIEYFSEVFGLAQELEPIFDLIEDLQYDGTLILDPKYPSEYFQKIITLISNTLSNEKAHNLPEICVDLNLKSGTKEEAFCGKYQYISSRLSLLSQGQLLNTAISFSKKYNNDEVSTIVEEILQSDNLNVLSSFNNIRKHIIEEINSANFLIWVAVAWFTDRKILKALYKKRQQGINIQIIFNDDEINKTLESNSDKKLSDYFEVYKIPVETKFENKMHNKFCIIDLKKVITGSYNWTTKAQYNKETITIIESRLQAEKFAKEFITLKAIKYL